MVGCTKEGRNLRGSQFVVSSLLTIAQLFSHPSRGTSLLQSPFFFQHILSSGFLCGWTLQTCCCAWVVEGKWLPGTLASLQSCGGSVCTDAGQFDWTQFACNCRPHLFFWNTLIWFLVKVKPRKHKHTCPQLHPPCLHLLATYQLPQKVNIKYKGQPFLF